MNKLKGRTWETKKGEPIWLLFITYMVLVEIFVMANAVYERQISLSSESWNRPWSGGYAFHSGEWVIWSAIAVFLFIKGHKQGVKTVKNTGLLFLIIGVGFIVLGFVLGAFRFAPVFEWTMRMVLLASELCMIIVSWKYFGVQGKGKQKTTLPLTSIQPRIIMIS